MSRSGRLSVSVATPSEIDSIRCCSVTTTQRSAGPVLVVFNVPAPVTGLPFFRIPDPGPKCTWTSLADRGSSAAGTNHHRIEHLRAGLMLIKPWAPALVDHMDVAPMNDRHYDRIEVETLLSKNVFVTFRPHLIGHTAQDTLANELPQPVG